MPFSAFSGFLAGRDWPGGTAAAIDLVPAQPGRTVSSGDRKFLWRKRRVARQLRSEHEVAGRRRIEPRSHDAVPASRPVRPPEFATTRGVSCYVRSRV